MRRYNRTYLIENVDKNAVIGKTKSGKKIYNNSTHKSHAEFEEKDHLDAVKIHKDLAKKSKDNDGKKYHNRHATVHQKMSVEVSLGF